MRIKSLTIYPLKAARGHSVAEAVLQPQGLLGDRRFVLVRRDGTFVSQRTLPRLALLGCHPGTDGSLELSWAERRCRLSQPQGGMREVTVWKDQMFAQDWGEEAHRWLTDLAGEELWLCEAASQTERSVNTTYTEGARVPYYFADGFPFLVVAEESLTLLNQKLQAKGKAVVSMDRFRPNIVIEGWQAHGEDEAPLLHIGQDVTLRLAKPCGRCTVTTVDQETGVAGTEPLATLTEYRRDPKFGICFGQNAYLVRGAGAVIRVGDVVTQEERS